MARTFRHPSIEDVELHEVLRVLGDPVRLRLVTVLLDCNEVSCAPLAAQLGVADSTLSHHLRLLREAGITRTRPEGLLRWTSLRREDLQRRFPGLLAVIEQAREAGVRKEMVEQDAAFAGRP
jgi:DNA-binding transcriptional ArsR family regulator